MNTDREVPTSFASNPFATKFIRAGALPFSFPSGCDLDTIRQRLQDSQWCGQIWGPHGSGKSTLLQTLDGHWESWGREPLRVTLRDRQRRLPGFDFAWYPRLQVVIDGYEQLSWLQRCRVRWRRSRARCGLLVTSHRSLFPPTIWQTDTNLVLAKELVEQLVGGRNRPTPEQIESCFQQADGNLRETFLLLYDIYQGRSQESDEPPPRRMHTDC